MNDNQLICDSIWLDIEYSNEKRYFTWDNKNFPDPKKMNDYLIKD